MDFIFITIITLWVLTELMMFLLKNGKKVAVDNKNKLRILGEFNIDGSESVNSSCSSSYEGDSGIVGTSTEESETDPTWGLTASFSKEQIIEIDRRKKRAAAKRLERQERDRKQLTQFLLSKQKRASTQEDGYETDSDASFTDMLDLLFSLVQFIRKYKIVFLEDMCLEFKLKQYEVISYIKDLLSYGIINGVIDDRGRFIYVAETESKIVGNFIQQQHLYQWPRGAFI